MGETSTNAEANLARMLTVKHALWNNYKDARDCLEA